jgi:hypothetical protein
MVPFCAILSRARDLLIMPQVLARLSVAIADGMSIAWGIQLSVAQGHDRDACRDHERADPARRSDLFAQIEPRQESR